MKVQIVGLAIVLLAIALAACSKTYDKMGFIGGVDAMARATHAKRHDPRRRPAMRRAGPPPTLGKTATNVFNGKPSADKRPITGNLPAVLGMPTAPSSWRGNSQRLRAAVGAAGR
jgi:hypothetical protein